MPVEIGGSKSMRKSLIIVLAGLLAVVVAVISHHKATSAPLAVYQGKPADEWLEEIFTSNQAAAMQAFRVMGTNALPAVVNGFRRRDSWTTFDGRVYSKLPARLSKFLPRPPLPAETIWSGASLVLMNQPRARTVLPELVELLREKENPARGEILSAISQLIDRQNQDFAPLLIPFLKDSRSWVRNSAASSLGRIGLGAKIAIPALTLNLKDSQIGDRVDAAWALWRIDPHADGVMAVLTQELPFVDTEPSAKWAAVYLHEINPDDVSLIPMFVKMLNGSDEGMKLSSAAVLGQYGKAAVAAVPALKQAIESGGSDLRQRALNSLKRIDSDAAAKYDSSSTQPSSQ